MLTLIYSLYPYKQDPFYPFKLGTAGHLPVSCVLLSVSCWPHPLAGVNTIFGGWNCHYFVPMSFEALHAGCVLLSADPVPLQGGFLWGNPAESCASPSCTCVRSIPAAFNEEPVPESKTTSPALP